MKNTFIIFIGIIILLNISITTYFHYDNINSIKIYEFELKKIGDELFVVKLENTLLKEEIKKISENNVKNVTVTAYSPRKIETDDDPTVTASMTKVREGIIAVSRDLFENGWTFGKKVYIKGHGVFEIQDLMNERFENRIDVFMWNTKKARKFGKNETIATLMG